MKIDFTNFPSELASTFRRAIALMILPALLLLATAAVSLGEVVMNGGFETGGSSPWFSTMGTGIPAPVAEAAHSGDYGVALVGMGPPALVGQAIQSQLVAGKVYHFTAWINLQEINSMATTMPRYNPHLGIYLGAAFSDYAVVDYATNEEGLGWQKLEVSRAFTAGELEDTVTLEAGGLAAFWLDDISGVQEQLSNWSFDTADGAGWSVEPLSGWAPFAVAGEFDLHRTYSGTPVKMLWQELDISNVGGAGGTASMRVKSGSYWPAPGTISTTVYLDYLDGNGNPQRLLLLNPDNSTVGLAPDGSAHSTNFTLPADARKITGFSVDRTDRGMFQAMDFQLNLELVAPLVTITSPVPGASFPIRTAIPLVAEIDATNSESATRVEFYADGTLIGQGQPGVLGPWNFPDGSDISVMGDSISAGIDYHPPSSDGESMYWMDGSFPTGNLFQGTFGHWDAALDKPISGNASIQFSFGTNGTLGASISGDAPLGNRTLSGGINGSSVRSYSLTWATATAGAHVLTVRAYYGNGSYAASAPVSITVSAGAESIKPVLSVASPANAAKLVAPGAVFAGTVVELGSKPVIEFSTDNGAHWLPATISATSVKSPYAWTANVMLVPGVNAVQFRATDLSGNVSNVVTRTVTYTVPQPVISSPAAGASVGLATNVFKGTVVDVGGKPTVEFSTDSGATWSAATILPIPVKSPYAWTANFTFAPGANTVQFRTRDPYSNSSAVVSRTVTYTVPPPVVTSPAAGAKITAVPGGSDTVTFKGTVPDAGGMPGVEFSTDGGASWTAAGLSGSKAPYAWSANATLSPGTNTLLFRTADALAQKGQPVSRSVTYLKPSTAALQIAAQGNGTFTNVTNGIYGKNLNLNMPYTVTATPKTGMIFKEWLKNGASFSRNATLTFTMEEGLTLTPVFIVNPFPAVVGTFNGLAGNGTETNMSAFFLGNGFVTLTTTGTGTFTGSLRLEGQALSLSGKFDGYGETTLLLKRTGKSAVAVALTLDLVAPGKVTGTVTPDGGTALAFEALPGVYTGVKPSIHPLCLARYTVVLPAPDGTLGHGYATMVVDAKGLATFAGKLADGTTFTTSARTVDDGNGNWVVPVHIPLYTGFAGMLLGEVVVPKIEPAAAADVVGNLGWLRPVNAKATMFPAGLLKTLSVQGERYLLTTGFSLLTGNATTGNFTLTIDPGLAVLTSALKQDGTWPKTNAPVLTKPPTGLSFTFTPATGVIKGAFNRTVLGKAVSTAYEGVVLCNPKSGPVRGAGFFTTGNASAAVEVQTPNSDMEQIPAGGFQMGNALSATGDGQSGELPVHSVNVSAFYMGKYEVTKEQWDEVRAWGLNNGYADLDVGEGKAANHPVQNISWFAMLKWCNARSQKEWLTPCYTVGGATYKTGDIVPDMNAGAKGYRLPTEAEWEKAARGGLIGKRFPWGDRISRNEANYYGRPQGYSYDDGPEGHNPAYATGSEPYTSPVGSFAANGYGLYDMAGNVWERCWDRYSSTYYSTPQGNDPTGDPLGPEMVVRGGASYEFPDGCRVSFRAPYSPSIAGNTLGFRCVRR